MRLFLGILFIFFAALIVAGTAGQIEKQAGEFVAYIFTGAMALPVFLIFKLISGE